MLTKHCHFPGRDNNGEYLHIVRPGEYNDHLVKVAQASPVQLEHLRSVVYDHLVNDSDKLYALVSAMGAGEYWSSNTNADYFAEEALCHIPSNWHSLTLSEQKKVGASWEWGYPTFYNARAFQHHRNKDVNRAFGTVEYVLWDDLMKRVLLIVAFSRAKADMEGALHVLEKIEAGHFPAVSMGARLLWDLCSYCADWPRLSALGMDPKKVLIEHRKRAIQGVATTPQAYCDHLKFKRNLILPDGRKIMMLNTHPRFFDISVVYIGADKTSFVLAKLAQERACLFQHQDSSQFFVEPWETLGAL